MRERLASSGSKMLCKLYPIFDLEEAELSQTPWHKDNAWSNMYHSKLSTMESLLERNAKSALVQQQQEHFLQNKHPILQNSSQ